MGCSDRGDGGGTDFEERREKPVYAAAAGHCLFSCLSSHHPTLSLQTGQSLSSSLSVPVSHVHLTPLKQSSKGGRVKGA